MGVLIVGTGIAGAMHAPELVVLGPKILVNDQRSHIFYAKKCVVVGCLGRF